MKKNLFTIVLLAVLVSSLMATDPKTVNITLNTTSAASTRFGIYASAAAAPNLTWANVDTTEKTGENLGLQIVNDDIAPSTANTGVIFWWAVTTPTAVNVSAKLSNLVATGDATGIPIKLTASDKKNLTTDTLTSSATTTDEIALLTVSVTGGKLTQNIGAVKFDGIALSDKTNSPLSDLKAGASYTATLEVKISGN